MDPGENFQCDTSKFLPLTLQQLSNFSAADTLFIEIPMPQKGFNENSKNDFHWLGQVR